MRLIQLSLILIFVLIPTLTHAAEPDTMPPTEPNVIVIFHDAFDTYQDIQPDGVIHAGMYHESTVPWVDLLVRLDDGLWYGPERNADDIEALPLPDGYAWECTGGFGCLPNGELWWNGLGTESTTVLRDADGVEVHRPLLRLEIHAGSGSGGAAGGGAPPPPDPGGDPIPSG